MPTSRILKNNTREFFEIWFLEVNIEISESNPNSYSACVI